MKVVGVVLFFLFLKWWLKDTFDYESFEGQRMS